MANSLAFDAVRNKLYVTASVSKMVYEYTPMTNGTLKAEMVYFTNR